MRSLQVTAFVALLALDAQRISQRRCDAAPCIRLPASLMYGQEGQDEHAGQSGESGQNGQLGEPLVEGSSGEMPLSTLDMYRESSKAIPAGASTLFPSSPPSSILASIGAVLAITQASASSKIPPPRQEMRMSVDCSLCMDYTRDGRDFYTCFTRILMHHRGPWPCQEFCGVSTA